MDPTINGPRSLVHPRVQGFGLYSSMTGSLHTPCAMAIPIPVVPSHDLMLYLEPEKLLWLRLGNTVNMACMPASM